MSFAVPAATLRPGRPVVPPESPAAQLATQAPALEARRAELSERSGLLTVRYQALEQRRAHLAGTNGGAELAAFNREAAEYQGEVTRLQQEQEEFRTRWQRYLDQARQQHEAAQETLRHLRTAVGNGDWEAQLKGFQAALVAFRDSPEMPPITALGKNQLARVTKEEVSRSLVARHAAQAAQAHQLTLAIQGIVNQVPPVVTVPPDPSADIWITGYHPGATKPDLKHVTAASLLKDRQLYRGDYLHVEGAPNVYYRSRDCEFNPQTKYFITDRTRPKRLLSPAEIDRLVELYHQLGRCEEETATLDNSGAGQADAIWNGLVRLRQDWPR